LIFIFDIVGSPGVGKTTLVEVLSSYFGYKVTRINLSDQTDLMDLSLGQYLPVSTTDGE
jgi:midasin